MTEVFPGRPKVSTEKKNANMVIKKKNRKEKLATRTANMAFAQVVDIQHWVISRRCPGTGFL